MHCKTRWSVSVADPKARSEIVKIQPEGYQRKDLMCDRAETMEMCMEARKIDRKKLIDGHTNSNEGSVLGETNERNGEIGISGDQERNMKKERE